MKEKGTILKIYEASNDLTRLKNKTVLDVMSTDSDALLFEYAEKNLLLQFGINGFCVIDQLFKKVIANFKVKGRIENFQVSLDGAYLIV